MSLNQIIQGNLCPQRAEFRSIIDHNTLPFAGTMADDSLQSVSQLPTYFPFPLGSTSFQTFFINATDTSDYLIFTTPEGKYQTVSTCTISNSDAAVANVCRYWASPDGGVTRLCVSSISIAAATAAVFPTTGWVSPPGWSLYASCSRSDGAKWVVSTLSWDTTLYLKPIIYSTPLVLGEQLVYTVPANTRTTFVSTAFYTTTGFGRVSLTSSSTGLMNIRILLRNAQGDWPIESRTNVNILSAPTAVGNNMAYLQPGDQLILDVTANEPSASLWWINVAEWPLALWPASS